MRYRLYKGFFFHVRELGIKKRIREKILFVINVFNKLKSISKAENV